MDEQTPGTAVDVARRAAGFLTEREVAALAPDVLVLDPTSALIGRDVTVGTGTVVHPSATLQTRAGGSAVIGSGVRIGPGPVTIVATAASVRIGDGVELGPGPVTIVATGSDVEIGSGARLTAGCLVEAPSTIGTGAQVLGPVSVRDVVLGAGGDHHEPDPDRRGGVVKGAGLVRGVRVGRGEVVVGGSAEPLVVERQRTYHPGAPHTAD
ncbi:hypothetical protein I8920_07360 [Curtobacterium sp. YC1]|uniref:hypothetical protein n=1 Tax=Curtobacterium sp. YC1 TaxID=2795488 RepID=UPI0018E588B3|nr:hypothetical protein [Curtobacterium sp. YC1]QQD77526.1 hypothetical protein I8920_07360 [Curtobacterium sp. YC1]